MNLSNFMAFAIIIISIALIGVILIQGQTSSGLGSVFGGTDIYRTRRGMEKTLFNTTFALSGILVLFCLIAVILQG